MYQEQNNNLSQDLIDYYGAISEMDDVIGKLRNLLQELGIKNNTLLWFSSDNGPEGLSPGVTNELRGMKGSLYEGGVRVPSIKSGQMLSMATKYLHSLLSPVIYYQLFVIF